MNKYNRYDKFGMFQDADSLAVKLYKSRQKSYEEYQQQKNAEEIGKEVATAIQKELSKTLTIK